VSAVALIVLVVGAIAGYGLYLDRQIDRVQVKGLAAEPVSGADPGTENILMIGSTDRCSLKVQNPAYGLCSQGVTGVNSDVVMVLHLDPATRAVSILSIPRDLFVPNARATGANKIDAALVEGPSQLVAAIEEDFGIPIQHFVELNFDTFANVVNALGGIKMYFPEPVYDAYSGLDVQTPRRSWDRCQGRRSWLSTLPWSPLEPTSLSSRGRTTPSTTPRSTTPRSTTPRSTTPRSTTPRSLARHRLPARHSTST
jgi:LCP family protein required for cell wall assembly